MDIEYKRVSSTYTLNLDLGEDKGISSQEYYMIANISNFDQYSTVNTRKKLMYTCCSVFYGRRVLCRKGSKLETP
jgi:hypothetical protein